MTKPQRVIRTQPVSADEARRLNEIRRQTEAEFPPASAAPQPVTTGVGAQVRTAREARKLTWYSLAELAKTRPETIRDLEYGRSVQLSDVEAVAAALGLSLELVEQH